MDFTTACHFLAPDVLAMIVADATREIEDGCSRDGAREDIARIANEAGKANCGHEFELMLNRTMQSVYGSRPIKEVKMVTPGRLSDYKRVHKMTPEDMRDANLAECDCGEIGLIPYIYERDGSKVVLYECPRCKQQQEV